MKKAYSRAIAAVALLLSILLSPWLNKIQVEARPISQVHSPSSSSMATSSSQALGDLPAEKRNGQKQVESSFRRIPPSNSNPTQNKTRPPSAGNGNREKHIAKTLGD